jgi:pimeloyl-ACP methyl ester carboxylesterase
MTTDIEAVAVAEAPAARDTAPIRAFTYRASEAELEDLRRRIAATRLPEQEPAEEASQAVTLARIQELARYWATEYDWRKVEASLAALPQFITEIDGLDIHFIHVRSKHKDALPIVVTHGWPGSIVEQMKIIDPLTNPTAHGGTAADAFHVVIPSRPGCGFSGKPTTSGWDCPRIARAWAVLMQRLGYPRYVAQGGDWGSFVTEQMGVQAPPGLLGIHVNLSSAVPTDVFQALAAGLPPAGLSADESRAFGRLASFFARGLSYAQQMATHPRALYGIGDSPVGLAAWYLDNELWSHELLTRAFDGQGQGLTRDDLLDNITLTWLTRTAMSSTRLYRENKLAFFAPAGVGVPVAVSVFPDEVYQPPLSWVERAYPRLVHYNEVAKGGHFAAWEQPQLFVEELRAGLRSLRQSLSGG